MGKKASNTIPKKHTPRSFKNNSSNYKELNNIWNQMFDLVSKKVNVN